MVSLGQRLLDGDGLKADAAEGESWLRKAVAADDPDAMETLGNVFVEGDQLHSDPAEGVRWLEKAVQAGSAYAGVTLGYHLYQQKDHAAAAKLFLWSYRHEERLGALNLAYMLRRGEVADASDCPPIAELLAPLLADGDHWARVNQALCLAAGVQTAKDWPAADQLIALMAAGARREDLPAVQKWWHNLAKENDPEGHLVLAWLARHGIFADPDGLSLKDRLARARAGPWADAPAWLEVPASGPAVSDS